MEELFNPVSILLHMFNAALLFAVLYWLLYKPVGKFMQARADRVAAALADADARQAQAQALMNDGHAAIENAQRQAADTVNQSVQQAKTRAEEIIAAARVEAEHILEQAHEEAARLQTTTQERMRDEAAQLAVAIAAQLLAREVTLADHAKLTEAFCGKVR